MATRKTATTQLSGARRARKPAAKREMRSWEKIIERSKRIPAEELARDPRDGAANIDHYLYGAPKQDPD